MPPASRLQARAQEQAFVCEQWKLIQSSMAIDKALHAFLTQKIDDCGQTVVFEAFRLVQQVLNPKGFVRKSYKSADSSLGIAIRSEDNAWAQAGLQTARQWDWMGSWHKFRADWKKLDETQPLSLAMVKNFCEGAEDIEKDLTKLARHEAAVYIDNITHDIDLKMPAVSASGTRLCIRKSMPDDLNDLVLRWETYCGTDDIAKKIDSKQLKNHLLTVLSNLTQKVITVIAKKITDKNARNAKKTELNGKIKTKKDAFTKATSDYTTLANDWKKKLKEIADKEKATVPDLDKELADMENLEDLLKKSKTLEPYWKFTMRSNDWAKDNQDKRVVEEEPAPLAATKKPQDIPDDLDARGADRKYKVQDLKLLFEELGLRVPQKKTKAQMRDILMKIKNGEEPENLDSEDNSTVASYKNNVTHRYTGLLDRPDTILEVGYFDEKSGLFKKRVVIAEIDGDKKTEKEERSTKLALKLMSSSNAQIPVNEGETYHIRSNFDRYATRPIEQSLMQTTDISLPEFADIVREYQSTGDSRDTDYRNFHHAIHLMHHMFVAHVKIAFLIHMQVMHGVDMLGPDADSPRMRNYVFFVNMQSQHIPEQLSFETDIPTHRRQWLQEKLMLHSRPQIKYWDKDKHKAAWTHAPLMHASTSRARMRTWRAAVRKGPLPAFPYEAPGAVPVTCVRIQRVNMKELAALVQGAAEKAVEAYNAARKLDNRATWSIDGAMYTVYRRQLPDRFFLTRAQQYDRAQPWNDKNNAFVLRNHRETAEDDELEHNWGYERPRIARKTDSLTPDGSRLEKMPSAKMHWDQLDVRMHFFHKEMSRKDSEWKAHAAGMWYLQDYIDFFQMIRSLPVPEDILTDSELAFTHIPAGRSAEQKWALARYAFKRAPVPAGTSSSTLENYYFADAVVNAQRMPRNTRASDAAHHRFSVLSYFFDCRDDGACRYRWEDTMLAYFGSEKTDLQDTEFDKFRFQSPADWTAESDGEKECAYFNQLWFQMTFFMELNFRNAIAELHYRLYDLKNSPGDSIESVRSLQTKAKALYNRQRSLLNTRALCPGPQGVTPGLSFWQKNAGSGNKNNVLKHLVLAQLNDELPELDPYLLAYVARERIPDAQLFLRMIGCPNLLALRELAVQHRYLLGEDAPAPAASQRPQLANTQLANTQLASTPAPAARPVLQNTLRHFPAGVQTEILFLLKKVQTDDSIFTITPAVHPSKRVVLSLPWFTQLVRRALDVHARVASFATPLQMKLYMFTREREFLVFRQLFCTADTLEHAHASRPLVFVLLQLSLALSILQEEVPGRSNEALELLEERKISKRDVEIDSLTSNCSYTFRMQDPSGADQNVPCTIGTSLYTWPLRDLNKINFKSETQAPHAGVRNAVAFGLNFTLRERKGVQLETKQSSMTVKEQHRWILLMYARPATGSFCVDVRHDDGLVVQQPPERPCSDARRRDTMILGVRSIQDRRCELHDVPDADIFFERVAPGTRSAVPFPDYVQDVIPAIADRTLVYVPAVFAAKMRQENPLHDTVFEHGGVHWRLRCVGYRAWAWKRLLVKCIFFDAWTKLMTRAMSLMALHTPVEAFYSSGDNNVVNGALMINSGFKRYFETLKRMIDATKHTLGDLQFKKDRLGPLDDSKDSGLRQKTLQVLLTVHKKKHTKRSINGVEIKYRECKVGFLDTQLQWVRYVQTHEQQLASLETTRFLKVHARAWQTLQASLGLEATVLEPDAVLVYGNYLHSVRKRTDIAVKCQNSVYVKFPKTHAVLKDVHNAVQTGPCVTTDVDAYFASLCDCRTYNVSHPDVLRKAYTPGNRLVLQAMGHNTVQIQPSDKWHPAQDDREDTWAFIAKNITGLDPAKIDWRLPFVCVPRPLINDSLTTVANRMHMYTLPDLYTTDRDKVAACGLVQLDSAGLLLNEDFLQKLAAASPADRVLLWNELRASTHFIQTAPADPATRSKAKVLKGTDGIEDARLEARVAAIQVQLLPKTNGD
jgi:hypothetical protein